MGVGLDSLEWGSGRVLAASSGRISFSCRTTTEQSGLVDLHVESRSGARLRSPHHALAAEFLDVLGLSLIHI